MIALSISGGRDTSAILWSQPAVFTRQLKYVILVFDGPYQSQASCTDVWYELYSN